MISNEENEAVVNEVVVSKASRARHSDDYRNIKISSEQRHLLSDYLNRFDSLEEVLLSWTLDKCEADEACESGYMGVLRTNMYEVLSEHFDIDEDIQSMNTLSQFYRWLKFYVTTQREVEIEASAYVSGTAYNILSENQSPEITDVSDIDVSDFIEAYNVDSDLSEDVSCAGDYDFDEYEVESVTTTMTLPNSVVQVELKEAA